MLVISKFNANVTVVGLMEVTLGIGSDPLKTTTLGVRALDSHAKCDNISQNVSVQALIWPGSLHGREASW